MTKQELCRVIADDMLDKQLLNEADSSDITYLLEEVAGLVGRHLEDYALVYKAGIIND